MLIQMADTIPPKLTFSQRSGFAPIPPQLNLKEISKDLRRLLYYAVHKDMEAKSRSGFEYTYFDDRWKALARDLHVRHFKQSPDTFRNRMSDTSTDVQRTIDQGPFNVVFDLVEFIIQNSNFSPNASDEIAQAFVDCRAAYRVIDKQIVAVGNQQQAEAFERAVVDAGANEATGARKHLIAAASALRQGDWTGCVRESIHAVESVAVRLAPGTNTLGAALKMVEKQGHIHAALKAAFEKLYGYSSDQEGVRHALVFDNEAKVDEVDALFMLGACAAFVSYLLARGGTGGKAPISKA